MIDLETIGADVLAVLERHALPSDNFGLSVTLSATMFDELFGDHPKLVNGRTVIVNITVNGVQGSVQILKRHTFPPELVTHPTP